MKLKLKAQHHLDAGTAEVSSVVDFCLMQCSPSASRVHPLSSKQPMEQQAEKVQLFTGWVLAFLRRAVADQPAALMSWTDQRGLLLTNLTTVSPVGSVTASSHFPLQVANARMQFLEFLAAHTSGTPSVSSVGFKDVQSTMFGTVMAVGDAEILT